MSIEDYIYEKFIEKFSKGSMKRSQGVGVEPNRNPLSKLQIVRDFNNTKRDYSLNLKRNLNDLMNKKITHDQYLDLQRDTIDKHFREAYLEGKLYSQSTEQGLSDYDNHMLSQIVAREMKFMSKFTDDVISGGGSMDYFKRLNMYVDSLVALFTAGKMAFIPEDSLIYWILGATDKHCEQCVSISARSPYRKRTLPTVPKAGDTVCLSNCKCSLKYENNDEYLNFILRATVAINGRDVVPDEQDYTVINSWEDEYYYNRGMYELTKNPKYLADANILKSQIFNYIKTNNFAIQAKLPVSGYITELRTFKKNPLFELADQKTNYVPNTVISVFIDGKQEYVKVRSVMGDNIQCTKLNGEEITINTRNAIIFTMKEDLL